MAGEGTFNDTLDGVLAALANPHRRAIIHAVALYPHSISALAQLRGLSLPAIHKHVVQLEEAGLLARRKIGRSNFLVLNQGALGGLQSWLAQFQTHWGSDGATLENYAEHLARSEEPPIPESDT